MDYFVMKRIVTPEVEASSWGLKHLVDMNVDTKLCFSLKQLKKKKHHIRLILDRQLELP